MSLEVTVGEYKKGVTFPESLCQGGDDGTFAKFSIRHCCSMIKMICRESSVCNCHPFCRCQSIKIVREIGVNNSHSKTLPFFFYPSPLPQSRLHGNMVCVKCALCEVMIPMGTTCAESSLSLSINYTARRETVTRQ